MDTVLCFPWVRRYIYKFLEKSTPSHHGGCPWGRGREWDGSRWPEGTPAPAAVLRFLKRRMYSCSLVSLNLNLKKFPFIFSQLCWLCARLCLRVCAQGGRTFTLCVSVNEVQPLERRLKRNVANKSQTKQGRRQ